MNTASKVILGSSLAAGVAAAAIVYRRKLGRVADKAADVVRAAVGKYGKIPGSVIQNFLRHNIPALIDKHIGSDFPWALAAAIAEIESGGDPSRVNDKSGATGLLQILGGKNSRGMSKEERLDPDKSLAKMVPEWRGFIRRIKAAGVIDPYDIYSYVYFAHNGGVGALEVALKHAGEGFEKAVGYYRNMPWLDPKASKDPVGHERAVDRLIEKRIHVARKVASHTLAWAALEPKLRAGQLSTALGRIIDWVDVY